MDRNTKTKQQQKACLQKQDSHSLTFSYVRKLIGLCFTVQLDNDPKPFERELQDFLKAKKLNILQWPSQSPDLNLMQQNIQLERRQR